MHITLIDYRLIRRGMSDHLGTRPATPELLREYLSEAIRDDYTWGFTPADFTRIVRSIVRTEYHLDLVTGEPMA